jgi:tetratricopeptide (TPR) repeat protein
MDDKPFLRTHNYFQMYYFYACSGASNDYYFDNEEELGKKYFDMAEKVLQSMEDPDVLDPYDVGMLYAEPGAYFIRHKDYEKALELLNKGLKLAPDHARILARLEIAHIRMGNPEWEAEEEDEIEIDSNLFYEEFDDE